MADKHLMAVPRLLLLALLALALTGGAAADAKQRPIKFGTTSTTDPYSGSTKAIAAVQHRLDRRIDIVHWYQSWGGGDWAAGVQGRMFDAVLRSDRVPLLTWEPWDARDHTADQPRFRLQRIVDGEFDDYMTIWARALGALDRTIYLRPMHEFNGNWYPWSGVRNGNTPTLFKQAWRRMHRVFRENGADRVKFVWAANAGDVPRSNRMERYYPGGPYVDVLGLDGYNWGSGAPSHGGWKSFRSVVMPAYARLAKLGDQPIWITETASDHRGGSKPEWVREMFRTAERMKRLRAIVWFDENKERDWRLTSSREVVDAFGI